VLQLKLIDCLIRDGSGESDPMPNIDSDMAGRLPFLNLQNFTWNLIAGA
jgi:hypothetical protein